MSEHSVVTGKQANGRADEATAPRRGRILHVDDDEANRYAVTRSLVRAGYEVTEAASGAEALARLAEARPDLMILDVRLPDLDGFEVCRRVKADPLTAGVPVLHLSANFISGEDKAHGLDGGADAYLIRPVAPIELIATVNALIRARRAEEGLRLAKGEADAARANAERANRIKDEFLATLSHELRTPLTAIVGWASILQRGRASPAEMLEGLKTIERNAKAQAQLIEDLLDVSRIISGKLRLNPQRVELSAVIDAAIGVVRPLADAKRQWLERSTPGGELVTWGDPTRLQQVLWNLLSNAVKFTPEGGEVRIDARRAGGMIEVTVSDTGRGIDAAFLPHIFDRFAQAEVSTDRASGGLGLGLAIVRQLVEAHGGTIRAASDGANRGSMFVLRLPGVDGAGKGDANAEPKVAHDEPADPTANTLEGLSMLVVEDDADCRTLATYILQGCGARVVEAASVAAAFDALGRQRFDVIVSDIGMPGEDGYELIRRLRLLHADAGGLTPAVALSAFVQREHQLRMLAGGFDAHVGKPVEPGELCRAIAAAIAVGRQRARVST